VTPEEGIPLTLSDFGIVVVAGRHAQLFTAIDIASAFNLPEQLAEDLYLFLALHNPFLFIPYQITQ